MRRLFWVGFGAGAGIFVMRKATRTAEAYSPEGLARSVAALGDSVRYFIEEVRAGMSEREAELREALGLEDPTREAVYEVGDPPPRTELPASATVRELRPSRDAR